PCAGSRGGIETTEWRKLFLQRREIALAENRQLRQSCERVNRFCVRSGEMLGPSLRRHGVRDKSGHLRELLALACGRVAGFQPGGVASNGRGETPLAPAIVLAFTERFAPSLGYAEVEFLDVFIFGERTGLTGPHPAAVFST